MPTREVRLSVGGRPQVNLLPEDLRSARRVRRVRRVMVGAVVASVMVAAAGCGGAFLVERHAAGQMLAAKQQADSLQGEQTQFSGVTAVRQGLTSSVAAQRTAAVRMIDWESYMDQLAGSLPQGLSIGSIAVDSTVPSPTASAPGTPSPQAGTGLTGSYVATVTVHVLTTRLATVQTWLGSLTTLKGYVDASPGAVSTASTGGLDVAVTLHLNAKAYTTPAVVGASTATDTAATSVSPASSNGEQQ